MLQPVHLLIVVMLAGIPISALGTAVLFRVFSRRRAKRFGYDSAAAYLRAAPSRHTTRPNSARFTASLGQYDDHRPLYPWLASIAVRLAQNWLRQRGRTTRREGTRLDSAPEPRAAAAALSELTTDERKRHLWQAVSSLPSGERAAVVLYYRDELAVGDIAKALGVTSGTIKTLLFRARRRLRGQLDAASINVGESTL